VKRVFGATLAALGALSAAPDARADVSSWLYAGTGATHLESDAEQGRLRMTLDLSTGMGSPPSGSLIVGGLLRSQTHFSDGTDLALLLRLATHGFANGEWGVALDGGGFQRFWGTGSEGWTGALVLGGPWGLTLDGVASFGSGGATSLGATLGLDLARLTVYRRSGSSWWKNEFPAHRPDEAPAR
jgi:hypothetical protein